MPVRCLISQAATCRHRQVALRRTLTSTLSCAASRREQYVIIGAGFAGVATAYHLLVLSLTVAVNAGLHGKRSRGPAMIHKRNPSFHQQASFDAEIGVRGSMCSNHCV